MPKKRVRKGWLINDLGQPVTDWVGPGDTVVFPGPRERRVECLVWLDGAPAALLERREADLSVMDQTFPLRELHGRVFDQHLWAIRRATA